jgi:hypothetical protein
MLILRFLLGIVAAVAFGVIAIARRSNAVTIFAVIFVVAMAGLAAIVTISQVQEHRAATTAGEQTVHWQSVKPPVPVGPSGLPAPGSGMH